MSGKLSYWDDARHQLWQSHYTTGAYGGVLLAFTAEWCATHLPKECTQELLHDIRDDRTGETYVGMPFYVSYDEHEDGYILDDDFQPAKYMTLQSYMCGSHHCGCHRALAINTKDPTFGEGDLDCREIREHLLITKIYAETMPELVLYSETLSEEELCTQILATKPVEL